MARTWLLLLLVPCSTAGCTAVGCAQPAAWQSGGIECLASPAPNGAADPTTGCPLAIDRTGPDFDALDALTRSPGPHRYVFEPRTTRSERARRASACCYTLEYPPPPPPPPPPPG